MSRKPLSVQAQQDRLRRKRREAGEVLTIFRKPLKESLTSVLPITAIVLVLCFTIAPVSPSILLCFLLGAVLIGFIAGLAGRGRLNPSAALFWKTGVCGGFTTFSTFSLESLTLLERGKWLLGGSYMLLSMALCLLGAALGQRLSRL